jgi:hypothetical protein
MLFPTTLEVDSDIYTVVWFSAFNCTFFIIGAIMLTVGYSLAFYLFWAQRDGEVWCEWCSNFNCLADWENCK